VDEPEMIRRAQGGDRAAYEELLRPLVGPGAALAFALLYDRPAAEDAFQEAAIRAWQRLRNLRPGSPFRPWFLGWGRNVRVLQHLDVHMLRCTVGVTPLRRPIRPCHPCHHKGGDPNPQLHGGRAA